ncbi:MAG: hypothetical protein ACTSQG_11220 [Promethearchaeota archaeon]
MVKLIKNDILKIKILKAYKKNNISYTASILADNLKSKFETIKKALEFFSQIGVVYKEVKKHGKKDYTYYNLTEIGEELINSDKI